MRVGRQGWLPRILRRPDLGGALHLDPRPGQRDAPLRGASVPHTVRHARDEPTRAHLALVLHGDAGEVVPSPVVVPGPSRRDGRRRPRGARPPVRSAAGPRELGPAAEAGLTVSAVRREFRAELIQAHV